jgi:transposase
MNRRLHGWAFAKLHAQITYKAKEQGIPVETVDPRNTSKKCHACETVGTRPNQGTFRCTASDCWVSTYQADLNAALRIADKYDRCGESQDRTRPTQKVSDNDSAADGASLTESQDNSANPETSIPSGTAGSREMTPEHDAS